MANVIGIEGVSFAGKSTLLKNFGTLSNISIIREHDEYIGGGQNFPPPAHDYLTARTNREFFIDLDILRWRDVAQALIEKDTVIVERGPLSCMAYIYAARHFTEFDILDDLFIFYDDVFTRNEIDHPTGYIYLDVSINTIHKRYAEIDYDFGLLVDKKMVALMKEFYEFYFSQIPENRWIRINSDGTTDYVFQQAISFVNKQGKNSLHPMPSFQMIGKKLKEFVANK